MSTLGSARPVVMVWVIEGRGVVLDRLLTLRKAPPLLGVWLVAVGLPAGWFSFMWMLFRFRGALISSSSGCGVICGFCGN